MEAPAQVPPPPPPPPGVTLADREGCMQTTQARPGHKTPHTHAHIRAPSQRAHIMRKHATRHAAWAGTQTRHPLGPVRLTRHSTAQRQHTPPPLHTPPTDGTADAVGDALAAPTLREVVALGDWDAALAGLAAGDWEGEEDAGDDPQPEVIEGASQTRGQRELSLGENRRTRDSSRRFRGKA